MENNTNKVMVASIVGVAIVFVAVTFYLVFSKINEDDKKENLNNSNTQEEQPVSLATDSELVRTLFSYVAMNTSLFYENKEVTLGKLSTSIQYEMAFLELEKDGITLSCDLDTMNKINQNNDAKAEDCFAFKYEIPEENLEKALKKVLGEKAVLNKTGKIDFDFKTKWKYKDLSLQKGLSSFQEENFASTLGSTIYYDQNKRVFVGKYETQGGGYTPSGDFSKIESASKKGKVVTIVEKVFFVDLYPNTPAVIGASQPTEYFIYSDFNHTKQIGTVSIEEFDDMYRTGTTEEIAAFKEKYIKKATTIIYTFEENEDGSYHFVKSTIEN